MLSALHAFFLQQPGMVALDHLSLRHIQGVYGSPQHLFAVAVYRSEAELVQNWNRAAHQLAFKIQRNMPLELDALRWDMYLLLAVEGDEVSAEVQKQIENNRFYFRKIVLTTADLQEKKLRDRLPLSVAMDAAEPDPGARPTAVWFDEAHFLRRLRESVGEDEAAKLTEDFFSKGVRDAGELLRLVGESVTTGGGADETARD